MIHHSSQKTFLFASCLAIALGGCSKKDPSGERPAEEKPNQVDPDEEVPDEEPAEDHPDEEQPIKEDEPTEEAPDEGEPTEDEPSAEEIEPFVEILSPMQGELLSSSAEFQVNYELPPGETFEGAYLIVDDEEPQRLGDFGEAFFLKTGGFDDGEHMVTIELRDVDGAVWRDDVAVEFDNPKHFLRSASPDRTVYQNGDEVVLTFEFSEPDLILHADLSEVDSEFSPVSPQIAELEPGIYEIRYTISPDNTAIDGEHSVVISSIDADGEEMVHRFPIRLANTPRILLAVPGGVFVAEHPDSVVRDVTASARILEVEEPNTLLSGNQVTVDLLFEQDPAEPVDKIYVALTGYAGYFVVPIEPTPGETVVAAQVSVELPVMEETPFADGEGDFELLFAVPDGNGAITDWITQLLHSVAAGAGGVQISLVWDSDADLDLLVGNPLGQLVDHTHTATDGGVLDVDSNSQCVIDGKNAENVSYGVSVAGAGTYQVYARLYDACSTESVNWVLTAQYCGETHQYQGTFTLEDELGAFFEAPLHTFELDCTQVVEGVATYDKEGSILTTQGGITSRPIAFAPVRIFSPGTASALSESVTNERGEYSLSFGGIAGQDFYVEVEASWYDPTQSSTDPRLTVTSLSTTDPYFTRSPNLTAAADGTIIDQDIHATVANSSGAYNIRDIAMQSYNWLSVHAPTSESSALPPLRAKWKRGAATGGTSEGYSLATQGGLSINGHPLDRDEWDDSVIAHEFMHFAFGNLGHSALPGGKHSGRTRPELAFSEGLATALGQQVLGHPIYLSETTTSWFNRNLEDGSSVVYDKGVAARTPSDPLFFGALGGSSTGQVSEYLVAMILWDLFDTGVEEHHDRLDALSYATRVLFDPPTGGTYIDRSGNGVDLIDYLDHFRDGLGKFNVDEQLYCLTDERSYPYDGFSSSINCP